ncbi:MAG: hypothetical protein IJD43_14535 [Thermoguttaceae bacterium]|nr:hypothetical protein [Planctomycetaceae bacterium]MBQ4144683.1 hypothetical protein [Thermoguttaceae bacterium]
MSTAATYDPILNLVVSVLSRIEGKSVDFKDLSMAAIVRNGYYLGLSYKSENTFVIWRSGCDTVEFYDRGDWTLLESVQISDSTAADVDMIPAAASFSAA